MPNRDQLTYYEGNFFGAPKTPSSSEVKDKLQQLIKLDFLLASRIDNLPRASEILIFETEKNINNLRNNTDGVSDIQIYEAITVSVRDWLIQVFKDLHLDASQNESLREAFFANELGRAGLSIVIDICCFILADSLHIRALHFSQGVGIPQEIREVEVFKNKLAYIRHYFNSDGLPKQTTEPSKANSFTKCSFGELSIALINQTEKAAEKLRSLQSLRGLDIKTSSLEEGVAKSNELTDGINQEDGLIYALSKTITSAKK